MIPADELCRDIQMKLPDCLWQLDYRERYLAGRYNEDFATDQRDGKTYLFGVAEVPVTHDESTFTWGIWVEVAREDHDKYLAHFQQDAVEGLQIEGHLANDIPGYADAMGTKVTMTLHAGRRPEVLVTEGSLADAQKAGLTLDAHRELDAILFGDDEEDPEADDRDFDDEER